MDLASPINAGWGEAVTINKEFNLFRNHYPKQVHLPFAMQEEPYTKEPGIYPVSWT
jgi:hypothetical protein